MSILESGEMYLETILLLKKDMDIVRSIDIANHLNYSRPSISRAVNILKDDGYITIDEKGHIEFTNKGEEIAKDIYEKHTALTDFFKLIGTSPETAEEDACRIEHVISEETFDRIKDHVKNLME